MIVIDGKEVRINRANVRISEIDEVYCELCRKIKAFGVETENRTGVNTKAIAGWTHTFDIGKEYPIPESKKIIAANYSKEIQWIHQAEENDIGWLRERDNNIWDEWCIDSDGIWREYVPLKKDSKGKPINGDPSIAVPLTRQVLRHKDVNLKGDIINYKVYDEFGKQRMIRPDKESLKRYINKHGVEPTIKRATYFGEKYANTDGEQYGYLNRLYQQPQVVEYFLKNKPEDRRMQINLWQRAHFAKAVLPSCVFDIMFTVIGDTLHAAVIQRSADVPAGLPFNIAQYAELVYMFAKISGFKVGTLTWTIMNAHIYVDQFDAINQQLRRFDYMKEYEKLIQTSTDLTVEKSYNFTAEKFRLLDEEAFQYFRFIPVNKIKEVYDKFNEAQGPTREAFNKIPMSKRYEILESILSEGKFNEQFIKAYEEAFERKISFEHMLTRENPVFEVADRKSLFDFSTEYVKKGDSYLNENPIGNKDLVLKYYHPTPFIAVPVAQ